MKKSTFLFTATILLIILFTQFYHSVNGLADDQIGIVTAERVIQDITPDEGYKYLMDKYIETGGLHPATSFGIPWINPMYTLVTHSYSQFVGLSITKWHLLSVLLFIILLLFAYKLGNFFFEKHGFIFPLLLATNLYILVVVRNSIILFSLSLIFQFGALYYFLKTHEKFSKRNFFLTCLFLFLAMSNGSTYSPVTYLYLLIILLVLFVWNIMMKLKMEPVKEFQFFKKGYYFLLFISIPFLSTISYFVNDIILNTPLGSSFDGFLYFTKSKFPPSEFPTLFDKISGSILKFKEVFLGTSFREIFGPHATFFPYKTPVLDKASAILFFLGMISFFKDFTYKKLIIISFLFYTFYYLYGVGAARIFIVFVPFLLLVSASGFVFLLDLLKRMQFHPLVQKVTLITLGTLMVYNVYYFNDYFVVKSNSNLMMGTGIAEVKSYIDSLGKNKVLVFMERGYPTWYLADFRKTNFIINDVSGKDELRKKINELEEKYEEVILIFPSNLYYVGNPGLLSTAIWEEFNKAYNFFFEAFPEKPNADKIVYSYQKVPQHYLFLFSKKKGLPKVKRVVVESASEKIPLNFSGEIQTMQIKGGVNSLQFGNSKEIPIRSTPSSLVTFNFGGESYFRYYKNYATDSYKENLYQKDKLKIEEKFSIKDNNGMYWIEPRIAPENPPYVLEYLFDFPYKIKKAEIKNDMRLFNSSVSQTKIEGYAVDDEKHFSTYHKNGQKFKIFEINSDSNDTYGPGGENNVLLMGNWSVGRLSSYKIIYPKSNKILLALTISAKYYNPIYFLANFYTIGNSSFIKFTLETREEEKPKIKENTTLMVKRKSNDKTPVIIDLIYLEKSLPPLKNHSN